MLFRAEALSGFLFMTVNLSSSKLPKSEKMMPEPGQQLRRVRERLRLRYRDVEVASQRIADRHLNDEFLVGLSRLADIENRGTVPSIYRLYSLCAIYGLDWKQVLIWYGINLDGIPADSASASHTHSRLLELSPPDVATLQIPELTNSADITATSYLSREIVRW